MGVNIALEVRAYGDAIASEAENAKLSERRGQAVRKLLGANGVDEQRITVTAMGLPPLPGRGEKSGPGKFDRRVLFGVVIQP
jgi:outer membrane protein OmpA-like peptidoglycan-associated protein